MTGKYEQAGEKVRRSLILVAVQSIRYVANGSVMKLEIAKEFGISEKESESFIAAISNDLISKINKL